MLIVSYDIQNDRKRTKFSKFLSKFGYRAQYSLFIVKNSRRVLKNILDEVKLRYAKNFGSTDSVIILNVCEACKNRIMKFGYISNTDKEVVFFE